MAEPHVQCPVCREAVPDRAYYAHAKECQAKAAARRAAREKRDA